MCVRVYCVARAWCVALVCGMWCVARVCRCVAQAGVCGVLRAYM